MSNTCEYCNKVFSNIYNKRRHQQTSKKCLVIQDANTNGYICDRCGKSFPRRDNMLRHQQKCTEPTASNKEMAEVMVIMAKLLEKNTETSLKSTNNFMNLSPLTEELLTKNLDQLTIDLIQEGGKGYATHAGHYPCKKNVVCTDQARKKLRWRDENNELINDTGGIKLAQCFFKHIAQHNEELINTEYSNIQRQVQDIAVSQIAENSNLVELLQKSTLLQSTLAKCQQAANGLENDLTKDFIRQLSRML